MQETSTLVAQGARVWWEVRASGWKRPLHRWEYRAMRVEWDGSYPRIVLLFDLVDQAQVAS